MVSNRKGSKYPPIYDWDDRMRKVQCKSLKPILKLHDNKWFTVWQRDSYYTVEYHESQVIILPIIANKQVLMIAAKRPVIDDITLELPAGGIAKGETAETAALRELAEETGVIISDESRLIAMPPLAESPNRTPKLVYVFRIHVTQKEYINRVQHDDEIEYVSIQTFDQIIKKLQCGEIYVAVPAAILGLYLLSQTEE